MFNVLNPDRRFSLSIDFDGVNFVFFGNILNPAERRTVDVRVAQKFPNLSFDAIPMETYAYTKACETLNVAIKKYPFELEEKLKDWELIDDVEFVERVFVAYKQKEDEFKDSLKKNKDHRPTKESGNSNRPLPDEAISLHSSNRDARDGAESFSARGEHDTRRLQSDQETSDRPHEARRGDVENSLGVPTGRDGKRYEGGKLFTN